MSSSRFWSLKNSFHDELPELVCSAPPPKLSGVVVLASRAACSLRVGAQPTTTRAMHRRILCMTVRDVLTDGSFVFVFDEVFAFGEGAKDVVQARHDDDAEYGAEEHAS